VTKILAIEDEEAIGSALEYQLQREGYDVTWVRDGAVGLETFETAGADLIVLDLMLPSMSGEEVCRSIRKSSAVPIIMLTAKGDEVDRIVGLELGADDYVTKPFSTRELMARVKAVLRRGRQVTEDSHVLEGGDIRLDSERYEATVRGTPVHLTRKEFEVLELLMRNAGRVLPRDTLMDNVWGADYYGDTRTLDVHIKRLRAKCEIDPHSPDHLLTVRGIGYKFVP
jgi:two-component system response regulator RegX3